jgi:hypothetical protein
MEDEEATANIGPVRSTKFPQTGAPSRNPSWDGHRYASPATLLRRVFRRHAHAWFGGTASLREIEPSPRG